MKKLLFLIGLVLLAVPTATLADSASIGGYGNTVKIINNDDIQMVNEAINISVHTEERYPEGASEDNYWMAYGGYAQVDIVYTFKNTTDEDLTVTMGFPEKCGEMSDQCLESMEDSWGDYIPGYKLNDFEVKDSGEVLAVEFRNDAVAETPGTNWYIYEVPFAASEEKVISNTYWISPSYYRSGMRWIYYILETGASWKDVIENADITVHFEGDLSIYDVSEITPAGYVFDKLKDTLEWHLTDLEPTEAHNIEIHYRDPSEVEFSCEVAFEDMGYSDGEASSFLPAGADGALTYYPCQAYDYSDGSAWVEGASGDGIGEWVKIPLESERTYEQVKILNGYSNQALWAENNRVKTARLIFPNGYEETVNLVDQFEAQTFNLSQPVSGAEWAKVEIVDVYQGSKFADTCLTEVRFLGLVGAAVSGELAFPDIVGHLYQTAIEYVKAHGIVEGYPDGYFRPDNTINRAELTKIIIEAVYPGEAIGANCFPDVGSEWFAKYVCFAKERGVVAGYPDGYFRPGDPVNYVEALKITFEAFGLDVPEQGFEWWHKYTMYADENGLSVPDVEEAGELLKRGQMAELIMRVMEM